MNVCQNLFNYLIINDEMLLVKLKVVVVSNNPEIFVTHFQNNLA